MIAQVAPAATESLRDILPMVIAVGLFQAAVIRAWPARLGRIVTGAIYVFVGLTLLRIGIMQSLLPVGGLITGQLVHPDFVGANPNWRSYSWLYAFVAAIGFSATLVEPTLKAIADRIRALTGGSFHPFVFRTVVATGVAFGVTVGMLRIVAGVPLEYAFLGLLGVVAVFVPAAPRPLLPLAFDSGGMATSVVIVPLIAALAGSVAGSVPGRDPVLDGFGLVMLVSLAAVASVLAFSTIVAARQRNAR